MSATSITETCQIVWWKGYVKGRFVALVEADALPAEVVGESPPVRWRGSGPPEPTEAAVQALEALTEQLVASGWTPHEPSADAWFGLVLSRSATDLAAAEMMVGEEDAVVELRPASDRREPRALTNLRSELVQAFDEIARERRLRLEAEEQARRESAARPVAQPAAQPDARPRRHRLRIPGELLAVVAAAVIAFLVLDSAYASAVAGLTAGAVVLGLDSLLAVRR